MDKRDENLLKGVTKRWDKEANQRADEDTGTYMPQRVEMTKREFDAHKSNVGGPQRKKLIGGTPLYRGSKIKVIN